MPAHHRPDPELLARCTELRALQVALSLVTFHKDFGDLEGWDEGIRSMLGMLVSTYGYLFPDKACCV